MRFKTRLQGLNRAWLALFASSVLASPALSCTLPPPPSKVPLGATATDSEMRAAMQTLKRYDVDVSAYLKCLAFEVKQGRLPEQKGAQLHNVAVEKLEKAAKLFNEQMRIFRGE